MPDAELLAWIRPREAIAKYAHLNGGSVNCRALLAEHLRDGNLRARARHVWTTDERSLEDAWETEPGRDQYRPSTFAGEFESLSKRVWRGSENWKKDFSSWRWKSGRFYVTTQKKPIRQRTMFRGVEFCLSDTVRLLVKETVDHVPSRGRPADLARWESFWTIVLDVAMGRDGGFAGFKNQSRFKTWVFERLELPLGGDVFDRTIERIWRRYELGITRAPA